MSSPVEFRGKGPLGKGGGAGGSRCKGPGQEELARPGQGRDRRPVSHAW